MDSWVTIEEDIIQIPTYRRHFDEKEGRADHNDDRQKESPGLRASISLPSNGFVKKPLMFQRIIVDTNENTTKVNAEEEHTQTSSADPLPPLTVKNSVIDPRFPCELQVITSTYRMFNSYSPGVNDGRAPISLEAVTASFIPPGTELKEHHVSSDDNRAAMAATTKIPIQRARSETPATKLPKNLSFGRRDTMKVSEQNTRLSNPVSSKWHKQGLLKSEEVESLGLQLPIIMLTKNNQEKCKGRKSDRGNSRNDQGYGNMWMKIPQPELSCEDSYLTQLFNLLWPCGYSNCGENLPNGVPLVPGQKRDEQHASTRRRESYSIQTTIFEGAQRKIRSR